MTFVASSPLLCITLVVLATSSVMAAGTFNIRDYGAKGDGKTLDTPAIVAAIRACTVATGGTVVIPGPATYFTGQFNLTSNMVLQIDRGATLLASSHISDHSLVESLPSYPFQSANTSPRLAAIIYGTHLNNVTIAGDGIINGDGTKWWGRKDAPYTFPSLIQFRYSSNIIIRGVTLANSPWYHLHPYACSHVLIDGITIATPSTGKHTDGIDPDSCDDVHITRCTINTADDHISVKSGKAPQGISYNRASTNVLIDHNTFGSGGGVALGSETSGGIYNIRIINNTFALTGNVVRMKSCPDYGAGIENVTYASNTVAAGGIAIFVDLAYECKGTGGGPVPIVRNINISDLTGNTAVAGSIDCNAARPCNINMNNVKLAGGVGFIKCNHVVGTTSNVSPKPCY